MRLLLFVAFPVVLFLLHIFVYRDFARRCVTVRLGAG